MPKPSARLAGLSLLAAVLALAALLGQLNLRLASSQAVSLPVQATDEDVPLDDPLASVWEDAAPVVIPLSAQTVTVPKGGGAIRAVTVRALQDGERIYFRLDWEDSTQDMSAFAPQDFRDAAAIQFPAKGVSTVPSFCMGQGDGKVNIWHWKADWQADIDGGFVNVPEAYPNVVVDYYPFDDDTFHTGRAAGNLLSQPERSTPVENLVAAGFGTLTSADEQMVAGKGVWQAGQWHVLFARDLKVDSDTYTPFAPGQTTNVAFAVWNGSQGERDGLKSVSQFADLTIESAPAAAEQNDNFGPFLALGLLIVVAPAATALVIYLQLRRSGE